MLCSDAHTEGLCFCGRQFAVEMQKRTGMGSELDHSKLYKRYGCTDGYRLGSSTTLTIMQEHWLLKTSFDWATHICVRLHLCLRPGPGLRVFVCAYPNGGVEAFAPFCRGRRATIRKTQISILAHWMVPTFA